MKSFLKQINESFQSLEESLDSKTAANDPKLFVKTAYDNGYSEKQIENFLQKAGHSKDDAETYYYNIIGQYDTGFASNGINEAAKPDYLDFDGDGNKDEPMKDALEDVECEKCSGAGCDHCDGTGYHKKVDEMSTTAGVATVTTPYAWKDPKKEAKKYTYEQVQKAMDHKYEQLIEGYRDFVLSDSKMSPARKVNASIRDVAKKLKEIEKIVEYTGRLKTESGIAHSGFSSGTHNALRKISERLIKISERVRSLGE